MTRLIIVALAVGMMFSAADAYAAAYTQEASTFSAGSGVSGSAGYENLGIIGQPGIVGSSASTAYMADHGFLPVLGGWKILYPFISATPGTLTFSLMSGATGSQDLAIGNSGGGTLNWSVAKAATDSIFVLNKTTGSNAGTVTVTANAAGLTEGSYNNALIISGAGIDQIAQVLLDLTVTKASYTLAVTLKLATPGKGGGTVTSTSPVSSLSCIRSGGNSDVICSADFSPGTITLTQTPGGDSQWAAWSAPGCGSNPSCQVALTTYPGTGVDVTFPYSFMAKDINSKAASDSLVAAYGSASAADTINTRAVTFNEGTVTFGSAKEITLVGGLDAYYQPLNGQFSIIQGGFKVKNGRVAAKGIKVK